MDDPGFTPDVRRDLLPKVGLAQGVTDFGAKDGRERLDRQQKNLPIRCSGGVERPPDLPIPGAYTKKVIDRVSPVVASYNRSYMKATGLTTALLLILLLPSPTRPVAFDPDLRQLPPSPPPFSYAY
jgi:hypothetical protein